MNTSITQSLTHLQQTHTPRLRLVADEWPQIAAQIGVPRRYAAASLADSTQTPSVQYVAEFLAKRAKFGHALVLAGKTGVGKTYAAVCGLRAWPKRSKGFFFFPQLCVKLLDQAQRAPAIQQAQELGFVVLDDFGSEYHKENGLLASLVDSLLSVREANLLPTIITTNLTVEEMRNRLSDRLVDRLRGDWATIKLVQGESMRVKS